jgi:hypothetical protein
MAFLREVADTFTCDNPNCGGENGRYSERAVQRTEDLFDAEESVGLVGPQLPKDWGTFFYHNAKAHWCPSCSRAFVGGTLEKA